MRSTARTVHAWAAWLLAGGILVQAILAGIALLELGGSGDFSTHIEFGYTAIGLLALAVLVSAVVARIDRVQLGLGIGLFLLYIVQTILPSLRSDVPTLAALHPANAMLMLVLAVWAAVRAMRPAGPEPTV